jgi:hypothetical protein
MLSLSAAAILIGRTPTCSLAWEVTLLLCSIH